MLAEPRAFGQRLRSARVHAGMSQSALESRSGIPKARLSRYENGHVLPSIDTLGRLAAALGVSEASLLGDQRAIIEEFVDVLARRGVRLSTLEQASCMANAVADILGCSAPPADEVATVELLAGAAVVGEDGASAAGAVAEGAPPV